MLPVELLPVETVHGTARVRLERPEGQPSAALLLGHGAGGGIAAPDLMAASKAALELGLAVGLVEQPYRVAGRRSAPPAAQLDAAWLAVVAALRDDALRGLPLVTGGRSSGARIACRTAEVSGAAAVLCLAFPLEPPPRKDGSPAPDRLHELDAVRLPVLVVQGTTDRFGMPPPATGRTVAAVPGDHGLKRDLAAVTGAVRAWLPTVVPTAA